jgi:hypothetical protein
MHHRRDYTGGSSSLAQVLAIYFGGSEPVFAKRANISSNSSYVDRCHVGVRSEKMTADIRSNLKRG